MIKVYFTKAAGQICDLVAVYDTEDDYLGDMYDLAAARNDRGYDGMLEAEVDAPDHEVETRFYNGKGFGL